MQAFVNELTPLESSVKYLRENCNLRYSEIGKKIGRDPRNIWGIYKRASDKYSEKIKVDIYFIIPTEHIRDSELSVFEAVVVFLHERYEFSFKKISVLIEKDNRVIWKIYNRAKEKNEN